ncbi:MAG TPA: helix-turn-helix transcriptional regulator [Virgibacillus sp.]|nr:helix-turn-helix transcriptional regulator [Virgibacillus sp.]HLR65553.1 helix-turn-helix transcriptional regulator [Virgibacillus sp.]
MNRKPRLNLDFIKQRRRQLRLTNQEMAEELSFKNASTYFKYENGTYIFKASHLPILADLFQCSMDDFFIFEGANE